MSGATELERYLEDLQVEGNLQSRGQFTLDFHKALEKLSGMARQNVHRWVFFAVQAAVGFGAAEMRISASSQAIVDTGRRRSSTTKPVMATIHTSVSSSSNQRSCKKSITRGACYPDRRQPCGAFVRCWGA